MTISLVINLQNRQWFKQKKRRRPLPNVTEAHHKPNLLLGVYLRL